MVYPTANPLCQYKEIQCIQKRLDCNLQLFFLVPPENAPIAQLDRASDYGSEGWGFDSSWAYFFIINILIAPRNNVPVIPPVMLVD